MVAMLGCGGDDGVSTQGSDCADVPTVGPQQAPPPTPAPDERAMLVAEGPGNQTIASDGTDDVEGRVSVVLYGDGDPEVEDPFADRDLGVWFSDDPALLGAEESEIDDQRHTTTVRGHEAFVARSSSDDMRNSKGAAEVSWVECDNLAISLRSHSFPVDELVSIAEQLHVAGSGVVIEPGSTGGIDEVLSIPGVDWLGTADLPAGPGVRHMTYFGYPGLGGGNYGVDTFTFGDEAGVEVLRTLFRFDHPGARQETVRGREALVYEHPTSPDIEADERFDVFWPESPKVAVTASGYGIVGEPVDEDGEFEIGHMTQELALGFVERLHTATTDEANVLLAQHADP